MGEELGPGFEEGIEQMEGGNFPEEAGGDDVSFDED